MRFLSILAMAAIPFAAQSLAADKNDEALKKLQGTWTVVIGSNDGSDYAAGGKFIVEGKKYKIQKKDGEEAGTGLLGTEGTFTIDATKTPQQIDFSFTELFSDFVSKGIYVFEGDSLKICAGGDRPKKYQSNKGEHQSLLILKRAK